MNALAYSGKTESSVLREEPETLDAELLQEEKAEAKMEAERTEQLYKRVMMLKIAGLLATGARATYISSPWHLKQIRPPRCT